MDLTTNVLVVDDEVLQRKIVIEQLTRAGLAAQAANDAPAALSMLQEKVFDVVLLDVQMPGMSGLDALREIRRIDDAPEVIMLTADKSLATGVAAMRAGAYDYLTKPAPLEEMTALIAKAVEKRRLVNQNASLRDLFRPLSDITLDAELFPVQASEAMRQVTSQAVAAAPLDSTVLITGESGTGKDVLARFIHARSARHFGPLITINCGALPETLFESEFFGHERGAFTGATTTKRGLIEAADSATLFLDEVGEMPLASQVKLLQFLERGTFRRVGATRDLTADVRVIAATNRNLPQAINESRFRADLYYRLNVIHLDVPPLRARPADIPALTEHFLELYRARFRKPALQLDDEANRRLMTYGFPGNVRELRNVIERAAVLTGDDTIRCEHLSIQSPDAASAPAAPASGASTATEIVSLDTLIRRHIFDALARMNNNRERAAALLGISERTLYRKLREYEASPVSDNDSI